MQRRCLLIILISFIFISNISAEKLVDISIAPQFQYLSGSSEYTLKIRQQFYDESSTLVTATIESLLEFPLDNLMAGVQISLTPSVDKSKWFINASYLIGLTDPGGKMKDSDWDGLEPYYSRTLFSYTESDLSQDMNIFEIEAGHRLFKANKLVVSIMAGFRYQKFSQNIIGFEGWWKYVDETDYTFSDQILISGDEPAIDYELSLKQPKIGLATDYYFSESFTSSLKTAYTMTFFNDVDDHLIRHKVSDANGDGSGFIGDLTFRKQLTSNPTGMNRFIELKTGLTILEANGTQSQEWYDDEWIYDLDGNPIEILVPKGTTFTGVPHKINSTQHYINLKVGINF